MLPLQNAQLVLPSSEVAPGALMVYFARKPDPLG
jgi:hypothetical protein